jgi:antitoxin component of RelBE/YafQ-DinJ toxin-antitoxin module
MKDNKDKKVSISLKVDKEIVKKAKKILKERELSIAAFLRLKLKELIKEKEEKGNGQVH